MTPIDYLLLAGVVLAGGYVVARLLLGWLRSSDNDPGAERDDELSARHLPVRVEKTGAPWHSRK
jgi:hypothetical protein